MSDAGSELLVLWIFLGVYFGILIIFWILSSCCLCRHPNRLRRTNLEFLSCCCCICDKNSSKYDHFYKSYVFVPSCCCCPSCPYCPGEIKDPSTTNLTPSFGAWCICLFALTFYFSIPVSVGAVLGFLPLWVAVIFCMVCKSRDDYERQFENDEITEVTFNQESQNVVEAHSYDNPPNVPPSGPYVMPPSYPPSYPTSYVQPIPPADYSQDQKQVPQQVPYQPGLIYPTPPAYQQQMPYQQTPQPMVQQNSANYYQQAQPPIYTEAANPYSNV